ncbi:Hypothetical predicted protein [Mytilus galloprovincialis]|uniref:DUF1758 domain-containing protein n=1 Tax=Mytilus galloprovincialis TaxID=29158 RepID=A0A8B6BET3_MYTGA|nr:Hypothetical predicted protein [Mytilus galloprovincialis]
MESDLREYGTAKGKINTLDANESENDENNNGVAVDPLQVQLQENQQVMKQVVEGLAQVINDGKNNNGVLLMISSVQCKDMSLTTLWDPGANMSLITHKTAKRLGLSGQDITLSVTKVGNVTEHVQSKEYVIPLTDLGGKIWTIKAYGMEEVTAEVARVDMSRVEQLFKGINKNDIQRPTGQVDILIGTDCCILMPNKEEQIGNLQLMRNQFGYCIRGSHPLLEVPKLSNHGIVRIY